MYPKGAAVACANINGLLLVGVGRVKRDGAVLNVLSWIYGQRLRNYRKQAVYI